MGEIKLDLVKIPKKFSFFSHLLQYELWAPNQTGSILAPIWTGVYKAKGFGITPVVTHAIVFVIDAATS